MEADWLTQLLDEQDVMVAGQLDSTVSSCVADGGFGVVSALTDDRNVDTSTESRSLTRRPSRPLVSAVKVSKLEMKEVAPADVAPTSPPFTSSSCVPAGAAWVMNVEPPKRRQAAARVPATKAIIEARAHEAKRLSVAVESTSEEPLQRRARRATGWSSRSSSSSLASRASSAHVLQATSSSEIVVGRVCSAAATSKYDAASARAPRKRKASQSVAPLAELLDADDRARRVQRRDEVEPHLCMAWS